MEVSWKSNHDNIADIDLNSSMSILTVLLCMRKYLNVLVYSGHQVSHHPMVMACHCEGKGWKFWGESNLKSKFWGQSIQLDPDGVLTLEFDDGETFQWSKVRILHQRQILNTIYFLWLETIQLCFSRLFFLEKNVSPVYPPLVLWTLTNFNSLWMSILLLLENDCLSAHVHSEIWKICNPIRLKCFYFPCQVTTTINNLILGRVYCHHHGIMNISGNRRYSCKLTFKEQSFLDRNPRQVKKEKEQPHIKLIWVILIYLALCKVQGVVKDADGTKVATLMGKWDESVHCIIGDDASKVKSHGSHQSTGATLLWEKNKPSANPTRYNLSSFAITLNELTPELKVDMEHAYNPSFEFC